MLQLSFENAKRDVLILNSKDGNMCSSPELFLFGSAGTESDRPCQVNCFFWSFCSR